MEYTNETIGRRLHSVMVDKDMKDEELAARMGVSTEVVKNWKSGRTGIPLTTAATLCDIFGLDLDRLAVRETA